MIIKPDPVQLPTQARAGSAWTAASIQPVEILLVDDRPENLLALEAVLTSDDYRLVKATSGDEALRHLLSHDPALILLDVQMPGLDGFQTAELIRQRQKSRETPIIFITANSKDPRYILEGYGHGAVDYIAKPFDPSVLRSKVAVFADLHRKNQLLLHHERLLLENERRDRERELLQLELSILKRQQADEQLFIAQIKEGREQLRRNKERSDFLAEASLRLSQSLDYEANVEQVARLAVPSQADWLALELLQPDGSLQLACLHHSDSIRLAEAKRVRELFPPETKGGIPRFISQVLRTGEPALYPWFSDELMVERHHGQEPYETIRKLHLRSAMVLPVRIRGKTLGALCLLTANSSREYAQDDLAMADDLARRIGIAIDNAQLYREAQAAIQARDEFLSIASHELKTPLTQLKLQTQFVIRALTSGKVHHVDKLVEMTRTSGRQLERLAKSIDELMDVSRVHAGKLALVPEELDLPLLVKDVAERFYDVMNEAGCRVVIEGEASIPVVGDRFRFEQVLINLLANAAKYAPGSVVRIRCSRLLGGAEVRVQDDGPGIPREQQQRIFDRFERGGGKPGSSGLGLGLYIVSQILKAHGGSIRVESEPGSGTTFVLAIPAQPQGNSEGAVA